MGSYEKSTYEMKIMGVHFLRLIIFKLKQGYI